MIFQSLCDAFLNACVGGWAIIKGDVDGLIPPLGMKKETPFCDVSTNNII